jgi:alpha-tubulin suppressor-like RCC1 family protein
MRSIRIAWLCLAATMAMAAASAPPASATSLGVAAWGYNGRGQLGDGTTENSSFPAGVCAAGATTPCTESLGEVTAIAAGGRNGLSEHGLALLSNGSVVAWGANSDGELGNGTEEDSSVPTWVCAVGGKAPCSGLLGEVAEISASANSSMALLKNGSVVTWGESSIVPTPVCAVGKESPCTEQLTEVKAISAGSHDDVALLKNGMVVAWGSNPGNGSESSKVPVYVCAVGETAPCVTYLSKVVAVTAGEQHDLALLESGQVVAWGGNNAGSLGNGTTEANSVPVHVCAVGEKAPCSEYLSEVAAVSAGGEFEYGLSLALLKSGKVVAWGANWAGQLGNGEASGPSKCGWLEASCSTVPVSVSELGEVAAISAGSTHSLALLKDGTVRAWGSNEYGDLGIGGTKGFSDLPETIEDIRDVAGVAAGGHTSMSFGPPIPMVNSVSPTSGPTAGGTTVMINGVNFTGATKVKFGLVEASSFTVESSTLIKVTAPAVKPGTVGIRVTTPAGTSPPGSGDRFRYLPIGTEYGRCKKVTTGTGKYSNASCTVTATGNYEWTPGFVKGGFTGKSVTETTVTIETTAEKRMVCQAESATGMYAETRQVAGVVIKLAGCEYLSTGAKCSSMGAAEGEVVTHTLEGTLGWLNEEKNRVGLDLFPAGEEEGEPWFEASCGATSIKVRGSVIAHITSVNNMVPTFTLKYKQKKGKQEELRFEGEAGEVTLEASINGGAFEKAGLGLETKLTNEEELEINTVV